MISTACCHDKAEQYKPSRHTGRIPSLYHMQKEPPHAPYKQQPAAESGCELTHMDTLQFSDTFSATHLVPYFLQQKAPSCTVPPPRGCLVGNSYPGQHSPSANIILIDSKELFQTQKLFRNYLEITSHSKKDTLQLNVSCNSDSPKLSSGL